MPEAFSANNGRDAEANKSGDQHYREPNGNADPLDKISVRERCHGYIFELARQGVQRIGAEC